MLTAKKKKVINRVAIVCIVLTIIWSIMTVMCVIGRNINTNAISTYAESFDPELDPVFDEETGAWTFTTDGEFEILQLTDVHIGGGFMSIETDRKAMEAVAELIIRVQPDLVILTGDSIYPSPIQAGTLNNMAACEMLAEVMNATGVYWAIVFGNHENDPGSFSTRAEMGEFYESMSPTNGGTCLFMSGDEDIDGIGNYVINVQNTSNEIVQSLYLFDSNSYVRVYNKYGGLKDTQLAWYEEQVALMNSINEARTGSTETVKSLAFFHIPLEEYSIAVNEYTDNGYNDTADVTYVRGVFGVDEDEDGAYETTTYSYYSDEVFETFLELGSTQGVFVGHDHLNTWSLDYKGITLSYGMSIDYLAYFGIGKLDQQRGGTIITINQDSSFSIADERLVQD